MVSGEEIKDYIIEKSKLFLLDGAEIYSLEVSGFAENFRVQILIDKLGHGLDSYSLNELGEMSARLNVLIEDKGYSELLSLELSTPGAERELRSFSECERFIGNLVSLNYRENEKIFSGVFLLKDAVDGVLELEEFLVQKKLSKKNSRKEKDSKVAFVNVKKANLYIDV